MYIDVVLSRVFSLQVPLDSIASHSGCKSGDYLVKINGENVFNLGHEEAKDLIRRAGNKLNLVVERGEMIVPSMSTAFPKPKTEDETDNKPKTYSQLVRNIHETFEAWRSAQFSYVMIISSARLCRGVIYLASI